MFSWLLLSWGAVSPALSLYIISFVCSYMYQLSLTVRSISSAAMLCVGTHTSINYIHFIVHIPVYMAHLIYRYIYSAQLADNEATMVISFN